VPKSASSCLPACGAGQNDFVWEMSLARRDADEGASLERVAAVRLPAQRLDQGGDVVGVAGDDLDEAILAGHQRLVVDAPRVRLAEAELAPLGEITARPLDVVV